MRSDTYPLQQFSTDFKAIPEMAEKAAAYNELDKRSAQRLRLLSEELICMLPPLLIYGDGSFWIENEGSQFDLHMATKTIMDKEKRYNLLSTASSRKNEAAKGFLGKLRDKLEEAMAAEVDHEEEIPMDIIGDLANHLIENPEWDGYERSVLRRLADTIKIAIRGGQVEIIVSKNFAK